MAKGSLCCDKMFSYCAYIWISVILYLPNLPQTVAVLRCYKCTITEPSVYPKEVPRLCHNFDYSDKYIVDCPYSTFCMKRDFTVNLAGPINGTVRDCASQKYEYQVYENDSWVMKFTIEDPYHEGCTQTDDKGQRFAHPKYCYCKGDLCNHSIKSASISKILLVICFGLSYIISIKYNTS